METDGRGCVVMMQTRDRKPFPYSNGGQLGQLLSCVAGDPVLSQTSSLPRCQCDSKAHLELQELWLHPTKEVFLYKPLFRERKFILPGSPRQTFPCGSLVRARSRASPTLIPTKETGMTMTYQEPLLTPGARDFAPEHI